MSSLETTGSTPELPADVVQIILDKKTELEQGEEYILELGMNNQPVYTLYMRDDHLYATRDGETYTISQSCRRNHIIEDLVDAIDRDFTKPAHLTLKKRKQCPHLFHAYFEPVLEDDDDDYSKEQVREMRAQSKTYKELAQRWVKYIFP